MRKRARALCLAGLLSAGLSLAHGEPAAAQDSPLLGLWQELVATAPAGSVTYDDALPLDEGGIEVKGLSIVVDPQEGEAGRLPIARLTISEIAPLVPTEGPPERLKLRIEEMVLTPANSGLEPELFAALEATQISVNLTLDYLYLPEGGLLALQDLTIDMPFLARVSLSLDAAGVNLGRMIAESKTASEGVVVRRASLTFEDSSLMARLLRFEAKRDGVSFEDAQNEALREIAEELNWLEIARGGRLWSLAEAFGGMIIDAGDSKGPLSISVRPESAVALGRLFAGRSAEEAAKILNLKSSYAGSRAQYASTQSATPGRPDLSLSREQTVYRAGEPVVLTYAGLPGNQRDWVTVVPLGAPADTWGQWTYTDGKANGSFEVVDLEPGDYEARVYLDWPRGGFEVARRWYFSVEP